MAEVGLEKIISQDFPLSLTERIRCVWQLSLPAILAQITSVVMQYIDAAMVGKLGASASAAIGVVATSTWLLYGLNSAASTAFSVQIAQAVGAGNKQRASSILREGIIAVSTISIVLSITASIVSFYLPSLLGADEELFKDATAYFLIFSLSLPFVMLCSLFLAAMQCSGNMKLPSILSATMCILDVAFNAFFIYLLKLGVAGAALGTAASELCICIIACYFACIKSEKLKILKKATWGLSRACLSTAAKISIPMAFEQIALCGAQILTTKIIAPLGTVALAANSFGITAEAICYMPGYGIASAATTLIGQSIGAKKYRLAKSFAWLSVGIGMLVMALTGLIMYMAAPAVFKFFTTDIAVRTLGVKILRIEVLAEPLFAAYIIANGALRGKGDTLIPAILNLTSMWGVRLTLSYFLSKSYGLTGVWIAMCVELCFRGILYLTRLVRQFRGKSE